jgi:hypothetical protein
LCPLLPAGLICGHTGLWCKYTSPEGFGLRTLEKRKDLAAKLIANLSRNLELL